MANPRVPPGSVLPARIATAGLAGTILLCALLGATGLYAVRTSSRVQRSLLLNARAEDSAFAGLALADERRAAAGRAFLLTGDAAALAGLRRADAEFAGAERNLRRLVSDWPALDRLEAADAGYRRELSRAIAARRSGGAFPAVSIWQLRIAPWSTRLDELIDRLDERKTARVARLEAETGRVVSRAARLVVGIAGAAILLGAALSILLSRAFARVHEAERSAARAQGKLTATREAYRELEEVAYAVAHNMRAPLRAINGFASIAAERLAAPDPAAARDALGRVAAASTRMGAMIDGLVRILGVLHAAPRRERIDLTALAAEVMAQAAGGRPVAFSAEPGLSADADRSLTRLALACLLENALKFAPEGAEPRIEFGRDATRSAFFVRDAGVGFDMAHAGALFRPFERLHPRGGYDGVGVGLAVARFVARRHGGRMWAKSAPGAGATFYFTLAPSAPGAEADA